jgi:hypothetical protein
VTEITEEIFCHDFDEIMEDVIDNKKYYIINTREGAQVLLAPVNSEMSLDFENIQLRNGGN